MVGISHEIITHKLEVNLNYPSVREKWRKFAPEHKKIINEQVKKLKWNKFVKEVYCPNWLANMVVVRKKNEKWWVCIDFTYLNKACLKDSFPLPKIDILVDTIVKRWLLSFMDIYSGYNQIFMHLVDHEKTLFVIEQGIFYYKVMLFGLKNAKATYQQLVNNMFSKYLGDMMEVYVDSMLVKSLHVAHSILHLKQAFEVLDSYQMKLNYKKCIFGVSFRQFFRYLVTQQGIETHPRKIRAILNIPHSPSIIEV